MVDGPGPFGTVRVAVSPDPARLARICNGAPGNRDTHRILLFRSAAGGTTSGSWLAQRMATIAPLSPRTCGIGWDGGLKPARAQVGRTLGV